MSELKEPNPRARKRAQKLAEEITSRVKSVNYKLDGGAFGKFHEWMERKIAIEIDKHEMELLGEIPAKELQGSLPVVLYFENEAEREGFIAAVAAQKHMTAKKL